MYSFNLFTALATFSLLSSTVHKRASMDLILPSISLHKLNNSSKDTLSLGVSLLDEGVALLDGAEISVAVTGDEGTDPVGDA